MGRAICQRGRASAGCSNMDHVMDDVVALSTLVSSSWPGRVVGFSTKKFLQRCTNGFFVSLTGDHGNVTMTEIVEMTRYVRITPVSREGDNVTTSGIVNMKNTVKTTFVDNIPRQAGGVTKTGTVMGISFVTIIFAKIHVLELVAMGQIVKSSIELPSVLVQMASLEMQ